jgi:hypothetical protein
MGAIALMAASATIDTGVYKNHFHVICAVVFFLTTIIACAYKTIICLVVYFTTHHISKLNVILKTIVGGTLVIWTLLVLFYKSPNKYFTEIAEYSMTYLILAYVMLMSWDMKKFVLDYELN